MNDTYEMEVNDFWRRKILRKGSNLPDLISDGKIIDYDTMKEELKGFPPENKNKGFRGNIKSFFICLGYFIELKAEGVVITPRD